MCKSALRFQRTDVHFGSANSKPDDINQILKMWNNREWKENYPSLDFKQVVEFLKLYTLFEEMMEAVKQNYRPDSHCYCRFCIEYCDLHSS